jgi:hypothetical protein
MTIIVNGPSPCSGKRVTLLVFCQLAYYLLFFLSSFRNSYITLNITKDIVSSA